MHLGLVFFHGWGLSPAFWQPLATRLAQYPQVFADAGYFGTPPSPTLTPHLPPGHRWVGIGHSLGFARALQAPPDDGWAALVSVAGFARFCPPAENPIAASPPNAIAATTTATPTQVAAASGMAPCPVAQPRRVVERMLRAHARDPHAVLADFLHRCGLADLLPSPNAQLNVERLAADLALLLDMDVSAPLATLDVPVLALAARDDPIVPAALTEATFAPRAHTQLVWQAQGGHALGYAGVDDCAAAVQTFLERV